MTNCIVAAADMVIVQGNNFPPIKWQFLVSENPDVLFDLTGSVFKLTLVWPGTVLALSSDTAGELVVDLPTSMLTWNYTATESRAMPAGRLGSYELERWIGGTQQSMISAAVIVSKGFNPD